MKKIAILTLNGYHNYGNRLQNYAAQEVLKSLGFSVETVLVNLSNNKKITVAERINNFTFKKLYGKAQKALNRRFINRRVYNFKSFSKKYIVETDFIISDTNLPTNLLDPYSFFVCGSDQVWNPKNINDSSIYFLNFAPKYKRVAYAPSFGVSDIPNQYTERYKAWLEDMASLSVREEAGAKIIKSLTGRDATVLVDPTLMLSKDKWLSISKEDANKPQKEYLLTYFLGAISKDNMNFIESIAKKENLEIVNLAQLNDRKSYLAGPSEFIDYINSANVFFTDSFHGAVFSILLEKPFIAFNRVGTTPSMNSRIETLLSTFKLESRKFENIKSNKEVFEVDYSHIGPILDAQRNKSYSYLNKALKVKEIVI